MRPPPDSDLALVIRTDFTDQAAWDTIRAAIVRPVGPDGFLANVEFVDDREYEGATADQLVRLLGTDQHPFVIVADSEAMRPPEHLLLVVDLMAVPGRTFRAPPSRIQSIENNLTLANMDFEEFAEATDEEGVFRGFRGF